MVTDAQTLRIHPVAISLPCNPGGEDQDSERDCYYEEEPPLSANDDRFGTLLICLCVEEYHTKECLNRDLFFNLVSYNGWGTMLTETKVPGRKNIVTVAILKSGVW